MDEAVAAADLAQENALGGIVEEIHVTLGGGAVITEHEAEQQMLETDTSSISDSYGQPDEQPGEKPNAYSSRG